MKRFPLTSADAGALTASPVAVPTVTAVARDPEWIRLPKTGTLCPYSGLSRSKLNELVLPCPANDFKPPVKSIVLRRKGAVKGCRLISYSALIFFLNKLAQEQTEGSAAA